MTFADVCNFFWDSFLSAAKPEKPNTLFCYTGKIRVQDSGILVTVWLVPFYGVINCQDCYMEMVLEREKRTQCYCTKEWVLFSITPYRNVWSDSGCVLA